MHRSSTLAQYNGVSPKAAMLGGDIRLNALIKCRNAFVQHWLPRQDALRYSTIACKMKAGRPGHLKTLKPLAEEGDRLNMFRGVASVLFPR